MTFQVAPYVGAWIETLLLSILSLLLTVAPYVGAWIETERIRDDCVEPRSHPTWVRGLKLSLLSIIIKRS